MARRQAALAAFGDFVLDHEDLDAVLTEACRRVATALDADLAKVGRREARLQELLDGMDGDSGPRAPDSWSTIARRFVWTAAAVTPSWYALTGKSVRARRPCTQFGAAGS